MTADMADFINKLTIVVLVLWVFIAAIHGTE